MITCRFTGLALALLALVLVVRAVGAGADFYDAVHYPFEIDYGEGIVWQQAALFGTGRLYAPVREFPFLVFHYPPVYYALVRLAAPAFADLLEAGRAVSAGATITLVILLAGCVWVAAGPGACRWRAWAASCAGLTALCTANFWSWGLLMRVDMVAIALSFGGLVVAHQARGRTAAWLMALTLCAAAVFTKQVQVSAGCAVCCLALLQRLRPALACIGLVLLASLMAFIALQAATSGGFYQHIVAFNVNPLSWRYFGGVLSIESRDALVLGVGLAAAVWLARGMGPMSTLPARIRAQPPTASRFLALIHYVLCACTLLTTLKEGSNANYFIEFMAAGCVLAGLAGLELIRQEQWRWLNFEIIILTVAPLLSPFRTMPAFVLAQDRPAQWALVDRIRTAAIPVSSENMTLMMRAGVAVVYEPAIVKQLASIGYWDERPLLDLIAGHAFAFMITTDDRLTPVSLRSPAVDAAMRAAYPQVTQPAPGVWVNEPAAP